MDKHTRLFSTLGIFSFVMLSFVSSCFADPTPGVTVFEDSNSPTGYSATFIYENADAKQVNLTGTFAFYQEGGKIGELPEKYISAYDWEPGLFRASFSDFACSEEMSKMEGTDYWTITLPLPSGHYLYNYNVDNADTNIPDPANPPMASSAETGSSSPLSTFDVPYNELQGSSLDFSFMMAKDDGHEGKIIYKDYLDATGETRPLTIYLPFEYDENREEPYKTLYLSHGGGANEMEWFASGNVHYIFDNLIAEGTVEPTIIVAMNNSVYNWEFEIINQNMMENIIPFVEENFHVGTSASDRAFAGLSAGGMAASNIYYSLADQFDAIAIFSGCDGSVDLSTLDLEKLKQPSLMIGAGIYDHGCRTVKDPNRAIHPVLYLTYQLADLEIPYDYYLVKGGHDWTIWPQLIKIFAENYLWK